MANKQLSTWKQGVSINAEVMACMHDHSCS
jgi:hypothetical protein